MEISPTNTAGLDIFEEMYILEIVYLLAHLDIRVEIINDFIKIELEWKLNSAGVRLSVAIEFQVKMATQL